MTKVKSRRNFKNSYCVVMKDGMRPHCHGTAGGSSLLGLGWSKKCDELIVSFPEWKSDPHKKGILLKLASIYEPLGFVSPVTLAGKCLYRPVCC